MKDLAVQPLARRDAHAWTASMIAPLSDGGQGTPASFVARDFTLEKVPEGARLVISAQGLYRAFLNGRRVGEDLLTPGWTSYDDRIAYQGYPVSDLLRPGANRLEIWLGDGWWRSQLMWASAPIFNCYGDRIGAIAEIGAGGDVLLRTDESWRSGLLPIRRNGIYWGESVDARVTPEETHGVEVLGFDTGLLVPHEAPPVRELAPLAPVDQWQDGEAVVYDFGQNAGGHVRFTAEGEAGATVLVEHSEQLGPNKQWDNRNYRSARAAVDYALKGGAAETYAPMFTFMGYRYARVTVAGSARVTRIESVPISSVPERRGFFESGHPLVNRLVLNTVWSQQANFIEVPTDCPQRDERLGWTGDAQVFAGTACWLADSHAFLRKYLRDVMADQRPDGAVPHFSPDPTRLHPVPGRGDWAGSTGWGDAIVVIPWQLYLHYGDTDVLRECWAAMLKWLDYLWSISDGPIITPNPVWGGKGFTFGDWLQPQAQPGQVDNQKAATTIGDDAAATIYHFISTTLVARIADLLGKGEEAARLRARAREIRDAFAREFITPSGRIAYGDQTSYALSLLHDLVPEEHREAAARQFRRVVEETDGRIGTGFIGTPALLPALSRLGMHDLAAKMLLNERIPGWLYQVKMGATTIWERWDALLPDGTLFNPGMNSYNHYAYGAVCQWLFEGVAGLRRSEEGPGFARLELDPVIIPELSPVRVSHQSPKGEVAAEWRLDGDRVTYRVTLPEGCTGRFVPGAWQDVSLDGAAQAEAFEVGPGAHEIAFTIT
ncbi:Alfa-L-rhamnosidase [Rubellimicrobium mesophilum DSM 19309]|uniref:alpha-L-rhamnosidase n=1 Tax=Rubellimicrobium mesophilum DSM 19309 TaxID=442562 RepID=A0A017HM46_9RHOB|nr:family 78 glycoside hydrolase catalytic domain [Rubellimicrobium mesophilum]EYD75431.1 Alfa-L-rhamnosidase [Rubellimicrobium mesophilum DSM 19309]